MPFWASIRWKILLAFFVVVGISFLFAATNMTGLVRNYLTEQRTRDDTQAAEKLAEEFGPLFQQAASEEIELLLEEAEDNMDGRIMLLDNDGKVQYDSFGTMTGSRVNNGEVMRVLYGGERTAYGMHQPGEETVFRMSGQRDAEYVAYCASELMGAAGRTGVLLYVSRIQDMIDSLNAVNRQLGVIFAIITVAALVMALILSQVLTRPITSLSRTMAQMGKGDFSVRAPVRGSGELRELAENYNAMAAQLEHLDQTRNQFVSNASHELKTPLATMKIMLETMIYQPEMPAELRQEFMDDMNHEIDRLTGIITDLLTLTRLDSGGELRREPVDMSELTNQTIRSLETQAKQKNQTIESAIQPGLMMNGDRSKLNQVIYNLIDNAMKYTPEGGAISVTLEEDGNDLLWQVTDNGIGIPKEDQEHIFERFYRVDKARSRNTGGTGLGLSIVKQMVQIHGGSIRVESEVGKGSTFLVTLPRQSEESRNRPTQRGGETGSAPSHVGKAAEEVNKILPGGQDAEREAGTAEGGAE